MSNNVSQLYKYWFTNDAEHLGWNEFWGPEIHFMTLGIKKSMDEELKKVYLKMLQPEIKAWNVVSIKKKPSIPAIMIMFKDDGESDFFTIDIPEIRGVY